MALLGKSLALVSVGITCQPAFQMRHHLGLIQEVTGEPLEEHATPFDWLLCDAPGVAGMIRDRRYYPEDLSELKVNGGKPYWKRYGVHFWHQKLGVKGEDKWLGRARHCAENWKRIGDSARRVFILSNAAKRNAEQALADREMTKTALEWYDLWELRDALRREFGQKAELHVITADDMGKALTYGITIHPTRLGSEKDFKGSAYYWEKLFRRICG